MDGKVESVDYCTSELAISLQRTTEVLNLTSIPTVKRTARPLLASSCCRAAPLLILDCPSGMAAAIRAPMIEDVRWWALRWASQVLWRPMA